MEVASLIWQNMSDYVTTFGVLLFLTYFVFSASSYSNSSLLLSDRMIRNKFYVVMSMLFFIFGIYCGQVLNLNEVDFLKNLVLNLPFFEELDIGVVSIISVFICFILVFYYRSKKDLTKLKSSHLFWINILLIMIIPLFEGLKIYYIVRRLNNCKLLNYESSVILLVDITITILMIGMIFYHYNQRREISVITVTSELKNIINQQVIYGIITSESDSFYNILRVKKEDKTSIIEQLCINKAYILYVKEYDLNRS